MHLRSLDRPLRGRFPAARGALAIGLRWPAATSFARSRSAAWPRRFLRGRGHAALDVIASGEVTVRRCVSEDMRAVRALPRPLPLPPRAISLPLIDSLCPGTTSGASPRCLDVRLDEIIDALLGCSTVGLTVAPRQLLALAVGVARDTAVEEARRRRA